MEVMLQGFEAPPDTPKKKTWFELHRVLGYTFLFAVGAAVISGVYYWQTVASVAFGYETPVHRSQTIGWKPYMDTVYGVTLNLPKYMTAGELPVSEVDLRSSFVRGNLQSAWQFNFYDKYSDHFAGNVYIFDQKNFLAYNSSNGWVYYDDSKNQWFETVDVNIDRPPQLPVDESQNFSPNLLSKTKSGLQIFQGYGYGDGGGAILDYILPYNQKNEFVVFEINTTNSTDQDLTNMVLRDFPLVMESLKIN